MIHLSGSQCKMQSSGNGRLFPMCVCVERGEKSNKDRCVSKGR